MLGLLCQCYINQSTSQAHATQQLDAQMTKQQDSFNRPVLDCNDQWFGVHVQILFDDVMGIPLSGDIYYIETLKNKPSPIYSTQLTLPTQYPRYIIRRLQYKPANIPCNLPLQNWTQIRLGTIHLQPWSIYLKVLLLAMKKGLKRKGWTKRSISGDIPVSTGMLLQVEWGAIDPKWVDIHITLSHWWRTFLHCWNAVTLMSTVKFLGMQCLFR